jgi:hypothetical protein
MKDVQSDLSEAKWVFFGILIHAQIWLIGIPILIITEGHSSVAQYLMSVALTTVLSTSMVGFVIYPKIWAWAEPLVSQSFAW